MARRLVFAIVLLWAALARAQKFEPPRLVDKVEAAYPEEALRDGLTAAVTMELIVDETGRVADATVLAPAGHGFDEAALAAVKQFRFSPGRADGVAVPVRVTYRYVFTLARAPSAFRLPPSAGEAPVRLRGVVVERGTRTPVADAAVIAVDDAGATVAQTETAADGSFALKLAKAGPITVVIAAADHKTLRQKETIAEREALTVRYSISRSSYAMYESTVRAAPAREEVARVSLDGDEVRRIPGTRGDALAAVLNLPSVARSPFDLGQLVIRGSAPGESGAFMMGMQIPNAFHFGGLTSTFNSYLLDRFDLIPSNFSVRYGRLTGGIVDIVPREGRRDRIHGDIKMDLYDAHVLVEGPVGKGSFALAARRSYVDAFLGLFFSSGTFTVAPRYYDYEAQLDYPVAGGKLKLLVFGSDDDLAFVNRVPPDSDPTLAGTFSTRQWFHTLFASYKKNVARNWELETTLAVGPQHFDGAVGAAARFNLDLVEADLRFEARQKLTPRFRVTYGLDVVTDYFWVSVDAPQQTTEEVPLGPLGERPRVTLRNHGFEGSPAVYAQGELWLLPEKFLVTAGLRADYLTGYEGVYMQPRLMTRYRIRGEWWLKAGVGLFHMYQQAPYHDAELGNPKLRAEQAWHYTVGVEARPIPQYRALHVELNLFYKDLQNIAVTSNDFTQRDGKIVAERYSDEGIGRVYGGDLLVKIDNGKKLYGWLSYTLLKSERRDHPGDPWRPFQYDQTHILTLIAGYHLPWEIDVGARFRYVTGNPTTGLGPGLFDADQGVVIPIPGMPYAERLPPFVSLDVRVDKRFTFKSWILSIYLDVSNVTNHGNVEGYAYSYDYTRREAVTGLPILPSLGLRASF